jgi:hypothetical protein
MGHWIYSYALFLDGPHIMEYRNRNSYFGLVMLQVWNFPQQYFVL